MQAAQKQKMHAVQYPNTWFNSRDTSATQVPPVSVNDEKYVKNKLSSEP